MINVDVQNNVLWPNEPVGFTVISDYGFNDPIINNAQLGNSGWQNFWNPVNNGLLAIDSTAKRSPPSIYQVKYPIGFVGGSAPSTVSYSHNSNNEEYIGFWWKASNPWQGHRPSGVNKILFINMGNDHAVFKMQGTNEPYKTQFTNEFASIAPSYNLNPNINNLTITLGIWHQIELYFKKSTTSNSADGIIRWWVDNILLGNFTNINFPGPITEIMLSPTWGGINDIKSEADSYWYDHIHLSKK